MKAAYDLRTDRNLKQYSDDDATLNGYDYGGGAAADDNQLGAAHNDQGNTIQLGEVYVSQWAELDDGVNPPIYSDQIEIDGVHVSYVPSSPLTSGTLSTATDTQSVGPGQSAQLAHTYYPGNSVPCSNACARR